MALLTRGHVEAVIHERQQRGEVVRVLKVVTGRVLQLQAVGLECGLDLAEERLVAGERNALRLEIQRPCKALLV